MSDRLAQLAFDLEPLVDVRDPGPQFKVVELLSPKISVY
jgi:hypothetical protein